MARKDPKSRRTPTPSLASAATDSNASVATPPSKVPKAILALKEECARNGTPLTPDGLISLPIEVRRRAFDAFGYTIQAREGGDARKEFAKHDENVKRQMLTRFCIDGSIGKREVTNAIKVGERNSQDADEEWCTLDELAAPHRCNGVESAKLYSLDAKSRAHERPAFAKAGVLQYSYSKVIKRRSHSAEPPHQDILCLGMLAKGQTSEKCMKKYTNMSGKCNVGKVLEK